MLQIAVQHTESLPLSAVADIIRHLSNKGSQTQRDMQQLAQCLIGNSPSDLAPDYWLSLASKSDPDSDTTDFIGWASAMVWEGVPCLQVFVHPNYRNKGLGTALASCLIADNHLCQSMPLAVFAEGAARIAVRLGFRDIRRYRRVDDGWVRCESLTDDEPVAARTGVDSE